MHSQFGNYHQRIVLSSVKSFNINNMFKCHGWNSGYRIGFVYTHCQHVWISTWGFSNLLLKNTVHNIYERFSLRHVLATANCKSNCNSWRLRGECDPLVQGVWFRCCASTSILPNYWIKQP
eukprot:PhF_6_TR11680/c0_g1_i1/m.18923